MKKINLVCNTFDDLNLMTVIILLNNSNYIDKGGVRVNMAWNYVIKECSKPKSTWENYYYELFVEILSQDRS